MPAILARLLAGLIVAGAVLVIFVGPSRAKDVLGKTRRDRTRNLFLVIVVVLALVLAIAFIGSTTY